MTRPFQFQPPVTAHEFIARPEATGEGRTDVGILFVGAGPAGLAGALHLARQLNAAPDIKAQLGDLPIVVIEKGRRVGSHLLSGAVVNPVSLRMLCPDFKPDQPPFFGTAEREAVYLLSAQQAWALPFVPPPLRNHGHVITSISKLGGWLAQQAEKLDVTLLTETAGVKLLVEDGRVQGVLTNDVQRDRNGQPLPAFQPGTELRARFTVLCEGGTGHLTQAALEQFGIHRPNPQVYALGVKEVWEVARPLDRIIHTMGWPLRWARRYHEFGGAFAYPLGKDKLALGLVTGLDAADARHSTHDLLQTLKLHPLFKPLLEGGKRLAWGAKVIPEGGYYSLPERFGAPGLLLAGDAAGFVNVPALKGIHYAVESGMLAADAIMESLRGDAGASADTVAAYETRLRGSCIFPDLYAVRNVRQAFQYGFAAGSALSVMMLATGGRFPGGRWAAHADSEQAVFLETPRPPLKPDNRLTFDKLSSVFLAGNRSRDNQPNHIRLATRVPHDVGEAWIHMCPAEVYEWKDEQRTELVINASNCVHCGAISAKGGRLTPAEGGSGPEYTLM